MLSRFRYMFSIFVHYLAVFVIALIVGQVGNVITNRNASRAEFERLLVFRTDQASFILIIQSFLKIS